MQEVPRYKLPVAETQQSILLNVPGGAIDLSDLLLSDAKHETKHGVGSTFESMAIPLPAYGRGCVLDVCSIAKEDAAWMVVSMIFQLGLRFKHIIYGT